MPGVRRYHKRNGRWMEWGLGKETSGKEMKTKGIVGSLAVSGALVLALATAVAPAEVDAATDRTRGSTIDHNPLGGSEGYCTWGAQEQIHDHTGYYIKALTGDAESWADQARAAGWTVVDEAEPRSIAVYGSLLVGGVGHVAWVEAVNGGDITITEMNFGTGATAANGYRTAGFHEFDTRTTKDVPGMSYILIP
jgi:surface antigen